MLIDLKKYLPFELDDDILEKIAFSETLLISFIPNKEARVVIVHEPFTEENAMCKCDECQCASQKKRATFNVENDSNEPSASSSSSTTVSSEDSVEFNDSFFRGNIGTLSVTNRMSHFNEEFVTDCLNTPLLNLDNSVPFGATSISVNLMDFNHDKMSILKSSRYSQDGYEVGLSLIGTLDRKLHTLDETSVEHMKKSEEDFVERECSIIINSENYKCELSSRAGDSSANILKSFTVVHSDDLLLEGAFCVLFRYIAITRWEGKFKVKQLNLVGELCDVEITSQIHCGMLVNKVNIPVMKICKKKSLVSSGVVKVICFIMTFSGQIIQVHSSNSKYVIHIRTNQRVDRITKTIEVMPPDRKDWKKSIDMFFEYLYSDIENPKDTNDLEKMVEKTKLQTMLTDYFSIIIWMKPLDVLPFTQSYFFNIFSKENVPHNSYFDKTFRRVRYSDDF